LGFRWRDASYDPLSPAFVRDAWVAWVASLPARLTHVVPLSGGRSELRPLWIAEVLDCDDHVRLFSAFVATCCALDAQTTGRKRTGTALGPFLYTAIPKPGNLRAGRHAAIWFADYDYRIRFFEPADGVEITLLPEELAAITEGEAA